MGEALGIIRPAAVESRAIAFDFAGAAGARHTAEAED
jgi:hypothetical protein